MDWRAPKEPLAASQHGLWLDYLGRFPVKLSALLVLGVGGFHCVAASLCEDDPALGMTEFGKIESNLAGCSP
jgi:hypothetical protein